MTVETANLEVYIQPISQQNAIRMLFDKIRQEKQLDEDTLKDLYFHFPSIIIGALDIIDTEKATKLVAQPSGRTLYSIISSSRGSKVKQTTYACLPPTWCSCPAFIYNVKKNENLCYVGLCQIFNSFHLV
jgi:iron only hydrogenase large subunit-like protein